MDKLLNTAPLAGASHVGLSIKEWATQVGIASSSFYLIEPSARPRRVKVGRRVLVVESPREWLERMSRLGSVPTKRHSAP